MNDVRSSGKQKPRDQREQQRELQAARGQRRDEEQRKAQPSEHGEWRGSGVCGDRHTD